MEAQSHIQWRDNGRAISLLSPTSHPKASHFLWNKHMVAQVNCRGYMISQFMQPEPAKYSHGPNLEAKTFIQPEQPFYTEHPGRFFYIKNNETGEVISLPYEPMRKQLDSFEFTAELAEVVWTIQHFQCTFEIRCHLAPEHHLEFWTLTIKNASGDQAGEAQRFSIYSCFSIGYMSWMNQGAHYDSALNAIIATSVSPYQKVEQLAEIQSYHDKTFFMSETAVDGYCMSFSDFVGEGGLTQPDGVFASDLPTHTVSYETPIAVTRHDIELKPGRSATRRFLFGPAKSDADIANYQAFCNQAYFEATAQQSKNYQQQATSNLTINAPDTGFNHVINNWLPRQSFYHGDVNRLSTDPQTRNFLQDAMGMIYVNAAITRERLIFALSQQRLNGEMPDGILLTEDAELKYINQVPHADHNVWLPLVLQAYLKHTGDVSILNEPCCFSDSEESASVLEHIELALNWLLRNTDHRGLSLIAQGDWCDPMNMVGYKGKGVSSWLTMATSYAIQTWLAITEHFIPDYDSRLHASYSQAVQDLNEAIDQHFLTADWYGRGITDDGRLFGIADDPEGKIFLNPQSWAMLAKLQNPAQFNKIKAAINQHLLTPHGVAMLAPAYTTFVDDVGRISQKSPGVSENGSVYNHAAIFYGFALFERSEQQQASIDSGFDVFRRMLATDEARRDQLPNFVPNYYRGAYRQFPEYAGRSSHLFNTGTVSWLMRTLYEHLCGFQGTATGVVFAPKLPSSWPSFEFQMSYRNANFSVNIQRNSAIGSAQTQCNGEVLINHELPSVEQGKTYQVMIQLPPADTTKPKLNIVMGVSGSGKSTVGKTLAKQQDAVFIDADDFHDDWAKSKMQQGVPLTDTYRRKWITKITDYLATLACHRQDCVLAYSGLKAAHRARFRELDFDLTFYYLKASRPILEARLNNRAEHFFNPALLTSQLESMEAAQRNESDITVLNADLTVDELLSTITKAREN